MNIPSLSIAEIQKGLHTRTFSAAELATEALRHAETENPKTNAYLTFSAVREALLSRRASATELATEALRFAEAENPRTNAYLHFSP